ncbi:MAG TPA: histidine kinase, partial [Pricia sp.]|nr:histidine kinase [Pricia sp.]
QAALASAEKSLELVNAGEIGFVRPTAYANAAMAYLKNKAYEKAEYYATESLKLSEAQDNLFLQKSAWGTLADVFAANKDFKNALEAHLKFSALKDSLNNQNRRVEINTKQMEFDFEKERALAQDEIKRQSTIKKVSILGGAGLLTVSVFGFILYKRRRDTLAQRKKAEFQALVSDTELKALRSQMNPHFIFNSLNSIGDYILKNDMVAAQDYLARFAKLMRTVLENSQHKEISLAEDLKFIELYLQVETKRLPGKFSYTINVENGLDPENILVPPLMLQPFIENCIWHGFTGKVTQGRITIDFRKKNNMLLCSVDDDGLGRVKNEMASARKSLGIAITENRIKILNQRKKANGNLQIIDKLHNTGTRVEVSLPLQAAF